VLKTCIFEQATANCNQIFPNGRLGNVLKVRLGSDFEPKLRKAKKEDVLELSVINGTHWLHLGGDVEAFKPVLGEPPETSSETTLMQALGRLNETAPNTKALIGFQPKNYASDNLSILREYSKNFPLWLYSEEPSDHHRVMLAYELPDKAYGLDNVFSRVQNEDILLDHDFYRSKSILNQVFAEHQVDESQKVYLQRKYKSIKKDHPNSFTDLFINNLLHLVEHLQKMNVPQFLPDAQKLDTTCSLTDIEQVESFVQRSQSECTLLKIRAGIFLKSDCLSILSSFLSNHQEVKLLIYAHPHDFLPLKKLVTSLNVIGQDNVLLDLPQVIHGKIRALSGHTALKETAKDELEEKNAAARKYFYFSNVVRLSLALILVRLL